MSVVESVRNVLWARRRQPDQLVYGVALAHERFGPDELLEQAVEAERAGFDVVCCSDHLAPWWEPGHPAPAHCANPWVWLGAAGQLTSSVSLGPAVTALTHRYNPVVVAQQIATLELMNPGRAFLAVGSGEAMNEVPAGLDWPSPEEQLARTEEALTIVTRLLEGRTVDFDGRWFHARGARLYAVPDRSPPVFMSAFGEQAAEIAGRLADGVWTLADPRSVPEVVSSYRRSSERAGREPGEIVLQGMFAWDESDDAALESAREWKPILVKENYSEDIHEPGRIQANGREAVSDLTFKTMGLFSADPQDHVRKIKALRQFGPTAIVLMNVSGNNPVAALRTYGESVLPRLRE
ncbi:flavin-dependent oxidoreductase, F420-dependent methylene-tetrahydromethanopterin reductase [Saccharomonospora marina XMU15]|uniref:Flavin-dependent oxidoreductase, F420-dependent methylene-tetrahydromethanopterin reductase n=1 Tax=Saccharomonospora marina XMU15 TaxID=882083 RepID=H5X346_9PSEU|nr:LLM class flavin-dependent oxidoreductase [Saccharomonospora marina]EHR53245.1 flavin-dependent oxidoreductase, F420-dependent methylene-tetrahydromethanopterin reductase [Saccharomonospora marina XMU15]